MSFDSNEDWIARKARQQGVDDERARIVAWLRQRAAMLRTLPIEGATAGAATLDVAAVLIEESKAPGVGVA